MMLVVFIIFYLGDLFDLITFVEKFDVFYNIIALRIISNSIRVK